MGEPVEPPKGDPIAVTIAPALALHLAYYKAQWLHGVLAPRGWQCRAWNGSSGYFVAITPKNIPESYGYVSTPSLTGPAVIFTSLAGGTSGRFPVAVAAARLFPQSTRAFVERVKAEHISPDSIFDVKPFPADQLHYLNDRAVQYTTPARRDGLGTQGMLKASGLPIRGLMVLNLEAESDSLRELQLRLPAELAPLSDVILQWESACWVHDQGCVD